MKHIIIVSGIMCFYTHFIECIVIYVVHVAQPCPATLFLAGFMAGYVNGFTGDFVNGFVNGFVRVSGVMLLVVG
ncbi:hypothetical protein [Xenorhabdus sp. PR6a]|uniref:hypothetical protein n=1 Tax=Xenorhabdus sp. PR6a TaxID=3025877 RepID=UPI0023587966|nr:hypothetical protein [Xenorhabdus sp. PR6a]